ncbi:MAG: hypothetical protein V4568_04335 [Pseudomonadota bacterium]
MANDSASTPPEENTLPSLSDADWDMVDDLHATLNSASDSPSLITDRALMRVRQEEIRLRLPANTLLSWFENNASLLRVDSPQSRLFSAAENAGEVIGTPKDMPLQLSKMLDLLIGINAAGNLEEDSISENSKPELENIAEQKKQFQQAAALRRSQIDSSRRKATFLAGSSGPSDIEEDPLPSLSDADWDMVDKLYKRLHQDDDSPSSVMTSVLERVRQEELRLGLPDKTLLSWFENNRDALRTDSSQSRLFSTDEDEDKAKEIPTDMPDQLSAILDELIRLNAGVEIDDELPTSENEVEIDNELSTSNDEEAIPFTNNLTHYQTTYNLPLEVVSALLLQAIPDGQQNSGHYIEKLASVAADSDYSNRYNLPQNVVMLLMFHAMDNQGQNIGPHMAHMDQPLNAAVQHYSNLYDLPESVVARLMVASVANQQPQLGDYIEELGALAAREATTPRKAILSGVVPPALSTLVTDLRNAVIRSEQTTAAPEAETQARILALLPSQLKNLHPLQWQGMPPNIPQSGKQPVIAAPLNVRPDGYRNKPSVSQRYLERVSGNRLPIDRGDQDLGMVQSELERSQRERIYTEQSYAPDWSAMLKLEKEKYIQLDKERNKRQWDVAAQHGADAFKISRDVASKQDRNGAWVSPALEVTTSALTLLPFLAILPYGHNGNKSLMNSLSPYAAYGIFIALQFAALAAKTAATPLIRIYGSSTIALSQTGGATAPIQDAAKSLDKLTTDLERARNFAASAERELDSARKQRAHFYDRITDTPESKQKKIAAANQEMLRLTAAGKAIPNDLRMQAMGAVGGMAVTRDEAIAHLEITDFDISTWEEDIKHLNEGDNTKVSPGNQNKPLAALISELDDIKNKIRNAPASVRNISLRERDARNAIAQLEAAQRQYDMRDEKQNAALLETRADFGTRTFKNAALMFAALLSYQYGTRFTGFGLIAAAVMLKPVADAFLYPSDKQSSEEKKFHSSVEFLDSTLSENGKAALKRVDRERENLRQSLANGKITAATYETQLRAALDQHLAAADCHFYINTEIAEDNVRNQYQRYADIKLGSAGVSAILEEQIRQKQGKIAKLNGVKLDEWLALNDLNERKRGTPANADALTNYRAMDWDGLDEILYKQARGINIPDQVTSIQTEQGWLSGERVQSELRPGEKSEKQILNDWSAWKQAEKNQPLGNDEVVLNGNRMTSTEAYADLKKRAAHPWMTVTMWKDYDALRNELNIPARGNIDFAAVKHHLNIDDATINHLQTDIDTAATPFVPVGEDEQNALRFLQLQDLHYKASHSLRPHEWRLLEIYEARNKCTPKIEDKKLADFKMNFVEKVLSESEKSWGKKKHPDVEAAEEKKQKKLEEAEKTELNSIIETLLLENRYTTWRGATGGRTNLGSLRTEWLHGKESKRFDKLSEEKRQAIADFVRSCGSGITIRSDTIETLITQNVGNVLGGTTSNASNNVTATGAMSFAALQTNGIAADQLQELTSWTPALQATFAEYIGDCCRGISAEKEERRAEIEGRINSESKKSTSDRAKETLLNTEIEHIKEQQRRLQYDWQSLPELSPETSKLVCRALEGRSNASTALAITKAKINDKAQWRSEEYGGFVADAQGFSLVGDMAPFVVEAVCGCIAAYLVSKNLGSHNHAHVAKNAIEAVTSIVSTVSGNSTEMVHSVYGRQITQTIETALAESSALSIMAVPIMAASVSVSDITSSLNQMLGFTVAPTPTQSNHLDPSFLPTLSASDLHISSIIDAPHPMITSGFLTVTRPRGKIEEISDEEAARITASGNDLSKRAADSTITKDGKTWYVGDSGTIFVDPTGGVVQVGPAGTIPVGATIEPVPTETDQSQTATTTTQSTLASSTATPSSDTSLTTLPVPTTFSTSTKSASASTPSTTTAPTSSSSPIIPAPTSTTTASPQPPPSTTSQSGKNDPGANDQSSIPLKWRMGVNVGVFIAQTLGAVALRYVKFRKDEVQINLQKLVEEHELIPEKYNRFGAWKKLTWGGLYSDATYPHVDLLRKVLKAYGRTEAATQTLRTLMSQRTNLPPLPALGGEQDGGRPSGSELVVSGALDTNTSFVAPPPEGVGDPEPSNTQPLTPVNPKGNQLGNDTTALQSGPHAESEDAQTAFRNINCPDDQYLQHANQKLSEYGYTPLQFGTIAIKNNADQLGLVVSAIQQPANSESHYEQPIEATMYLTAEQEDKWAAVMKPYVAALGEKETSAEDSKEHRKNIEAFEEEIQVAAAKHWVRVHVLNEPAQKMAPKQNAAQALSMASAAEPSSTPPEPAENEDRIVAYVLFRFIEKGLKGREFDEHECRTSFNDAIYPAYEIRKQAEPNIMFEESLMSDYQATSDAQGATAGKDENTTPPLQRVEQLLIQKKGLDQGTKMAPHLYQAAEAAGKIYDEDSTLTATTLYASFLTNLYTRPDTEPEDFVLDKYRTALESGGKSNHDKLGEITQALMTLKQQRQLSSQQKSQTPEQQSLLSQADAEETRETLKELKKDEISLEPPSPAFAREAPTTTLAPRLFPLLDKSRGVSPTFNSNAPEKTPLSPLPQQEDDNTRKSEEIQREQRLTKDLLERELRKATKELYDSVNPKTAYQPKEETLAPQQLSAPPIIATASSKPITTKRRAYNSFMRYLLPGNPRYSKTATSQNVTSDSPLGNASTVPTAKKKNKKLRSFKMLSGKWPTQWLKAMQERKNSRSKPSKAAASPEESSVPVSQVAPYPMPSTEMQKNLARREQGRESDLAALATELRDTEGRMPLLDIPIANISTKLGEVMSPSHKIIEAANSGDASGVTNYFSPLSEAFNAMNMLKENNERWRRLSGNQKTAIELAIILSKTSIGGISVRDWGKEGVLQAGLNHEALPQFAACCQKIIEIVPELRKPFASDTALNDTAIRAAIGFINDAEKDFTLRNHMGLSEEEVKEVVKGFPGDDSIAAVPWGGRWDGKSSLIGAMQVLEPRENGTGVLLRNMNKITLQTELIHVTQRQLEDYLDIQPAIHNRNGQNRMMVKLMTPQWIDEFKKQQSQGQSNSPKSGRK